MSIKTAMKRPTVSSWVPVITVAIRHEAAPDPVSTRRSGRGTRYLQRHPVRLNIEYIALLACFPRCSIHQLAGEVRPAQERLLLQKIARIPKLVFYDPFP